MDLESEKSTTGVIRDYSKLDGCKWLIELEDGSKFEPVSFPEGFVMYPDLPVKFTFEPVAAMSICMAGQTIEVTTIEALEKPRVFTLSSDINPNDVSVQVRSYQLLSHHVIPGRLYLTVQYSGCEEMSGVRIAASPMETRSLPPQRGVTLNWEETDCEKLIKETIIVDLSELKYTTTLLFQTSRGTERITVEPM